MAPLAMSSPAYEGPKALGFSKYASPAQGKTQFAAAAVVPASASSKLATTIATKQQIAVLTSSHEATPLAAELAVEQDTVLKKEVEEHTAKISRAVSSGVANTRQLLSLLRESTPGSEVVDNLWQELEQLFETLSSAKAALPDFMEKQRDNMSLYHASMMNETIRDTQKELHFQHKKVNTQHNLITEQQDAFQNYRVQTAFKLEKLENLQERVSRLTLEKGNFKTEVDKYKELSEQEAVRKTEDLETADALQKELETLVSSQSQLRAENETLRKTTTDILEQLKNTEQRVTDRFIRELAAKAEGFQKESAKPISLNTLINALKSTESATKKELDKANDAHRLLSVKYSNQASEHAAAFTKVNEQAKKIEALTADVDRLQKQNAHLQSKMESATELAKTNMELSEAKEDMIKQLNSLASQVHDAVEEATALKGEVQKLKREIACKGAVPVASNEKTLLEKVKALEEERSSLQGALAEWTELAKRSYKEYKDMLPMYNQAEQYRKDAHEKELQITDLKNQLASAKTCRSNGVGAASGDSAYWKQKYETLLSSF